MMSSELPSTHTSCFEPVKLIESGTTITTRHSGRTGQGLGPLALALVLAIGALAASPESRAKPCVGCDKKAGYGDPINESYDPLQTVPQSAKLEPMPGGAAPALQAGTSSTTLQVGTQETWLQGGAQGALLQATVEREGGPVNILFLIDASQSMKEKIAGSIGSDKEQKMDAAKRVLQQAIAQLPSDINVGLRVFGQNFSNDPLSDCQQSALLVPMGKNNRRAIISQVRQLRPFGLTPLTYGLMQSEQDMRYCNGPKTIILISDGAETCGGDPCAYIERLSRLGINMKVDIVGLGLRRDREARDQLNCIADKSGGKYYDANTAAELVDSITHSVKQAISGKVLTRIQTAPTQKPARTPVDQIPPGTPPVDRFKPAVPFGDAREIPADLKPFSPD